MPKDTKRITHKGQDYYSSEYIKDLLDKSESIQDVQDILFPEEPSAFDKMIAKGLGWNPEIMNKDMIKRVFKIEESKSTRIIHTRNFIDNYETPLEYTEDKKGEFHLFEVNFKSHEEYIKFLNELRKSTGLEPI